MLWQQVSRNATARGRPDATAAGQPECHSCGWAPTAAELGRNLTVRGQLDATAAARPECHSSRSTGWPQQQVAQNATARGQPSFHSSRTAMMAQQLVGHDATPADQCIGSTSMPQQQDGQSAKAAGQPECHRNDQPDAAAAGQPECQGSRSAGCRSCRLVRATISRLGGQVEAVAARFPSICVIHEDRPIAQGCCSAQIRHIVSLGGDAELELVMFAFHVGQLLREEV